MIIASTVARIFLETSLIFAAKIIKRRHDAHYTGSILHYIEANFGLGAVFNYNQAPLPYVTVQATGPVAKLFGRSRLGRLNQQKNARSTSGRFRVAASERTARAAPHDTPRVICTPARIACQYKAT